MSVSWCSLNCGPNVPFIYLLFIILCVSRKVAMREASMFNLTRSQDYLLFIICCENAS